MEGLEKSRILGGRTIAANESTNSLYEKQRAELLEGQSKAEAHDPEAFSDTAHMLEEIDFKTLRDIFEEYAGKSGVEAARLNFPKRSDIFIVPRDPDAYATYKYQPNAITVAVDWCKKFEQSQLFASASEHGELLARAKLFLTMFHEYTHATGRVDVSLLENPRGKEELPVKETRLGLRVTRDHQLDPDDESAFYRSHYFFNLLNEGVTDRIAEEVFSEYIHRTGSAGFREPGTNSNVAELYLQMHAKDSQGYATERRVVGALTAALAERAGVPEEIVWRAFVREYYSGEQRFDYVEQLFEQQFGSEFASLVANAYSSRDMLRAISENETLHKPFTDAVDSWLEHLKLARGAK